jgi:hypothetical protein
MPALPTCKTRRLTTGEFGALELLAWDVDMPGCYARNPPLTQPFVRKRSQCDHGRFSRPN